MSDRFTEKAEELLRAWSSLPGYEPLDEDMAINLACRIRDALREEAQGGEREKLDWQMAVNVGAAYAVEMYKAPADKLAAALALVNSMILSGENHSAQSERVLREALAAPSSKGDRG